MGWLNNVWMVGIGTGILSGLLVTWLLNLFISKKKDREHLQLTSGANREVIYSIRAGIPENTLPTREVIEALINSTARRYSVEPTELYHPKEITEELIKEVMDSSFLSSTKKVEYCTALIPLGRDVQINNTEKSEDEASIEMRRQAIQSKQHRVTQFETILSILGGLTAALATGMLATHEFTSNLEYVFHKYITSILLISMLLVIILTITTFSQQYISRRRQFYMESKIKEEYMNMIDRLR
jgi:hypothetical protein